MNLIAFFLFVFGVSIYIAINLLKKQEMDFFECLMEAISLLLITICGVSLFLVLLSSYNILFTLVIIDSLALLYLIIYIYRNNNNEFFKIKLVIPLSTLIIALTILVLSPYIVDRYEFIELTGDAGVYSITAIHIANEGKLKSNINVRDQMSDELKRVFDEDNLIWIDYETNQGGYFPGTYLSSKGNSEYYFQFYPIWPIMMATWYEIFGPLKQYEVMILLYVLIIYLIYYSLLSIKIKKPYIFLAIILLGTSPVFVYFTKYPTAELFLLFLVTLTLYLASQKTYWKLVLAGIVVLIFCFTHISSFMYLPLLILLIPFMYFNKVYYLAPFLTISFLGFLLSIPYGYYVSYQYFIDIYSDNFGIFFNGNTVTYGIISLVSVTLISLFYSIKAWCIYQRKTKKGLIT